MKKFWLALAMAVSGGLIVLTSVAARYDDRVRAGTTLAGLPVGGKSASELVAALDGWWRQRCDDPMEFRFAGNALRQSWSEAGVALRQRETLNQVPMSGFWDQLLDRFRSTEKGQDVSPILGVVKVDRSALESLVEAHAPPLAPARVFLVDGQFRRVPEQAGITLDEPRLEEMILASVLSGRSVEVPTTHRAKRIADASLEQIDAVVSEFSTAFNVRQTDRSSNIALAASKIDGLVLAPGDTFSFNSVVGRRTTAAGFRIAGVYVNGRHDFDLGGGICQVSTTLYNAVLLANLKITQRQNHSMAVPYVPVGQDATVDYGKIDFQFTNNMEEPVAISSFVEKGRITFRVLGTSEPEGKVVIERTDLRSWSLPIQEVQDPSLPAGKRKVVEKGSPGYSVNTFRVVRRGTEELSREPLGKSLYRGGNRIIHVGIKPTEAAPETGPPPEPEPAETQV